MVNGEAVGALEKNSRPNSRHANRIILIVIGTDREINGSRAGGEEAAWKQGVVPLCMQPLDGIPPFAYRHLLFLISLFKDIC